MLFLPATGLADPAAIMISSKKHESWNGVFATNNWVTTAKKYARQRRPLILEIPTTNASQEHHPYDHGSHYGVTSIDLNTG